MTSVYAIYFLLPFEKRSLCVYEINSKIIIEQGHQFSNDEEVVCLKFDEYLHDISNADNMPFVLFDVNTAVRILSGFPSSKFNSDNAPWKGISCLGKHLSTNGLFSKIRNIEQGKFGNYADWLASLPSGWEKLLIGALKVEHQRLIGELTKEGLLDQYLKVEMPLRRLFAKTGIQGITIDYDRLMVKYRAIDIEYYRAVKILELKYKYIVEMRYKNISYSDIKKYVDGYTVADFSKKYFWESIELMKESSEFLNCLLIEHRNKRDMAELLRISSSISKECKIEYDVFGTVTGRILLTRPGIQYIKRTSRDIFSPNLGYEFIYADYAQFEPGILAFLSHDPLLISLYNNGDVYTGLAESIGVECNRKVAKELFLSFVYGMSKENIHRRIVQKYGNVAGETTNKFFNQFTKVEEWKLSVIKDVKINGVAKGQFAYQRRVTSDDNDYDIARWAPNHIIQSTASGIFKLALCKIMTLLTDCRMLVPMHDAILLECPTSNVEKNKEKIDRIMKESFQETCPGMRANISFDAFAKDC